MGDAIWATPNLVPIGKTAAEAENGPSGVGEFSGVGFS
jgi:hypothetical protein